MRLLSALEALPEEGTPHPLPSPKALGPGGDCGNGFQGRKGATPSLSPCPPPAPAHPAPALGLSRGHCFFGIVPTGAWLQTRTQTMTRDGSGQPGLKETRVDMRRDDPGQHHSDDRCAASPAPLGSFPGPAPRAEARPAPPRPLRPDEGPALHRGSPSRPRSSTGPAPLLRASPVSEACSARSVKARTPGNARDVDLSV